MNEKYASYLPQIHAHQAQQTSNAEEDKNEGKKDLLAYGVFGNNVWFVHYIIFYTNIYNAPYKSKIYYILI
jgi:hypothetical protein